MTLGWNCRVTEYQAALSSNAFAISSADRKRGGGTFSSCGKCWAELRCSAAAGRACGCAKAWRSHVRDALQAGVLRGSAHRGVSQCVRCRGVPIYRGYKCTMAGQMAIEKLMVKRPDYFRVMPTPVADEAIAELVYIPQNVFLGTENDMAEIAAAIRKVQAHYAARRVARGPQRTVVATGTARDSPDWRTTGHEDRCSRLWLCCRFLWEDTGKLSGAKIYWSLR